jgi:hypothetical protein
MLTPAHSAAEHPAIEAATGDVDGSRLDKLCWLHPGAALDNLQHSVHVAVAPSARVGRSGERNTRPAYARRAGIRDNTSFDLGRYIR